MTLLSPQSPTPAPSAPTAHPSSSLTRLLVAFVTLALGLALPVSAHALQGSHEIDTSGMRIIERNHTDAWYVDTDSGRPVVLVNNGIRNNKYDPNTILFQTSPLLWGEDHGVSGLEDGGNVGYSTNSWDAPWYFSPGWSAPQFKNNGFDTIHLEFTSVEGPGRVALYGTNPLSESEEADYIPMLDGGSYYIEAGARLSIHGHQHAHWFFDRAGLYQIRGIAVATKPDGTRVESEPFATTFNVQRNERDQLPPRSDLTPPTQPEDPEDEAPEDESPEGEEPTQPEDPEGDEPEDPGMDNADEGTPIPYAPFGEKVTVSNGHVDLFNVVSRDGKPELNVKDDRTGQPVYRESADVVMQIDASALTEIPPGFHEYLGERGYLLGKNGDTQATLPFPGWDTTAVAPDFESVRLEFVDVQGPGIVRLYDNARLGSGVVSVFDSGASELRAGEVISIPRPSHVHANWLFEKPGVYTMSVQAFATAPHGGPEVASNIATYTWHVGDIEADNADPTPGDGSDGEDASGDDESSQGDETGMDEPAMEDSRSEAERDDSRNDSSSGKGEPTKNQGSTHSRAMKPGHADPMPQSSGAGNASAHDGALTVTRGDGAPRSAAVQQTQLPRTGAEIPALALVGALALACGGAAFIGARMLRS